MCLACIWEDTNLEKFRVFVEPSLDLRVLDLVVKGRAGSNGPDPEPEPNTPTRKPVHRGLGLGRVEIGPAPRHRRGRPLLGRASIRGQLETDSGVPARPMGIKKSATVVSS